MKPNTGIWYLQLHLNASLTYHKIERRRRSSSPHHSHWGGDWRTAHVTCRAVGRDHAKQHLLQHFSEYNVDSLPCSTAANWGIGTWLWACFILYSPLAFWDAKWFQKELILQLQLPFIAAVIRSVRYLTSLSCFEIPVCRLPDVVPLKCADLMWAQVIRARRVWQGKADAVAQKRKRQELNWFIDDKTFHLRSRRSIAFACRLPFICLDV